MDLHERLRHMRAMQNAGSIKAPGKSGNLSVDVSTRWGKPVSPDPPLETLIEGQWLTRNGVRCFVVRRSFPLTYIHGGLQLGELLQVPAHHWTPFVRGLEDPPLNPERLLFLDAETTGLGRGAGTYAFLIGLGSFVGGEFCIRQYFMPDYDSESALLELVAEELAAHDGLASFNGWTFDWPILQTRFLLARRPLPCSGEPHLDLLPLSRRLWRRMLPSCALASLEAGVLAVEREEQDVPSYLIPALYQDYVRLGRTRPIARIFYHNLLDLLSMVTLTARAGALLANPQAERARPFCDDLALGRMYESLGHHEEAIAAYRRAGQEAHRSLSFLLKRLGRYEEAMDIWRAQLGGREIYPYVELAKQYEHRLHDLEKARDMVIQALQRLEAHTAGDDARARRRELEHRLARLTRRLEMD